MWRHTKVLAAALAIALSACGGSGEDAITENGSASVGNAVKVEREYAHTFDFSKLNKSVLKGGVEVTTEPAAWQVAQMSSASRSISPPSLQVAELSALLRNPEDIPGRALLPVSGNKLGAGSAPADIPPPIANCAEIDPGYIYAASTPPAGYYACYQFTVEALAKLDAQALLPAGLNGVIALYEVDPVSGQLATLLDSDGGTGALLLAQTVNQYARIALLVQANNGSGGQAYQLGVFPRSGFDSSEPNDKPVRPTQTSMNKAITANIDMAGNDVDYYFYPLKQGQVAAVIKVGFNANQQVGVRLAQQTPQGMLWALDEEEMQIPLSAAGQNVLLNGLPNNPPGATAPHGLLIRVQGINPDGPAAEGYSLRVGVATAYITGASNWNNENLSRWYPQWDGSGLQTHSYIGLSAAVKDHLEQPVEGEEVRFGVSWNREDPNAEVTSSVVTDQFGNAYYTAEFPSGCMGDTEFRTGYGPIGSPVDHWSGTAQLGGWQTWLPGQNPNSATSSRLFYRICSETYLGNY